MLRLFEEMTPLNIFSPRGLEVLIMSIKIPQNEEISREWKKRGEN